MCCFFAALLFAGPRLGFLVWWLIAPVRVQASFANLNLPWLIGILGLIFAPWTILMYTIVFPLNGWDWLWIGLAIGADIVSYTTQYHNRHKVPAYSSTMGTIDPPPPTPPTTPAA
jgi:hypothetical protein